MIKTKKLREKKINLDRSREFIFQDENGIVIIDLETLNEFDFNTAFVFGINAHLCQRFHLTEQAMRKKPLEIEGCNVIDGLETSLAQLEQIYPGIRKRISDIDLRQNGSRVFKC